MRTAKTIIAMTMALALMLRSAGDSAPFLLDTATISTTPVVDSLPISWNAAWIGGDPGATVVIADNGEEVRRATGAGEFTYAPADAGLHELTYTTYIDGVAQDEVYTASFNVAANIPFDGLPATIEPDGEGGWKVTLTNDVDSADLPIEIPDNLGPVTIDLGGHDLTGADGEDGTLGESARPGGDGQPAIRIVPGQGDGEPTALTVVTTGGDAVVKGGDGGAGRPGGNGAPAVEVADGAQDGVLVNVGAGVTVQDGVSGTGDAGISADYTLIVGEYFKKTLPELGYVVPTDKTPYSVKAYGLPAGLKLKYNAAVKKKVKKGKKVTSVVVKPAKCEWWIEGVPTAALDYLTNPPYLVITVDGQPVTEPLSMEVLAQNVMDLGEFPVGTSTNAPFFLPGVTNGWTVSGLPTGLKYTAKLVKTKKTVTVKGKKKTVVTTNALPYSVYGKATKAGLFTITAKKKKGAFYETMRYRALVTPKAVDAARFGDDLTNITTMAYVPLNWNLESGEAVPFAPSAVGGKVAKVAGLPAGLAFAASTTYKDKKKKQVKQLGQTIVGTPTKPGTYVVTFTKNVKSGKKTVAKTAQVLWKVVPNDAEVALGFNEAGGVVESGVVGLNYGDLLSFSATSNATVTASGLPAGIKLARLEGDGGGRPGEAVWGFSGFTAKAGTYLVTVKVTLKGRTVTQRLALKVEGLPVWAKGTYNGNVEWKTENEELGGASSSVTVGLATVSVSSAGKISGKFQELGTNWTFSAASYTAATGAPPPGGAQLAATGTFICSNIVAKYAYKVKSGKKTETKYVTRTFHLAVSPAPVVPDAPDSPIRGVAKMTTAGMAGDPSAPIPAPSTTLTACQNIWGRSAYKTLGKKLFATKSGKKTLAYKTFTGEICTNEVGAASFIRKGDDKTGLTCFVTLSLKVTTAGAVTATATYDTGKTKKDPKTKKTVKVYYKRTCQSVVVPQVAADAEPFVGEVPLYFAPSAANGFGGFAGSVAVP